MTLKESLTTAAVLVYPDFPIPFTLYTNDCGDSIGFNVTQIQHGWESAIVYGGRNFSDTKKKYPVTEREALSVIVAIQKCRLYLLGNHFTIVDQQALKWLMSLCDPTGRLARWDLILQGYDFTTQYRQGKDYSNGMHYQDRSTPFPSNLCYHKLRQRNFVMLRTAMTSSNPLINIWKMKLYRVEEEKIMRQEGHYFLTDNNTL